MDFRPFMFRDAENFTSMVLALYTDDPEGEAMDRGKVSRTIEQLTFRPDKGEIIIFHDGHTYCGYSILLFLWSNELGGDTVMVDELYVKPQFRSQGLGKSFFGWLQTRYPQAQAFALETTPSNTRARQLYSRLGFEEVDNVRMLKKL